MFLVGPDYLCKKNLPYVADIFYFKNIVYTLPTGFTQEELNNIYIFPKICEENNIMLPKIIWEMCNKYFDNTVDAFECTQIIKPFLNDKIKIIQPIYARDIEAIKKSLLMLKENDELYKSIIGSDLSFSFYSREVLSHVLFEVYIELGFDGTIKYILEYCTSQNITHLIAAVIVNRLKIYNSNNNLAYDQSYYDIYKIYYSIINSDKDINEIDENSTIEFMTYRLFQEILLPIYGRCDSLAKSEKVFKLLMNKSKEIEFTKEICRTITLDLFLHKDESLNMQQTVLQNSINKYLIQPLQELTEQNKKYISKLLIDFIKDSTVICGLLNLTYDRDLKNLGIAITAGAVSSTISNLIHKNIFKVAKPEKFLLEQLKKNKIKNDYYLQELNELNIKNINLCIDNM